MPKSKSGTYQVPTPSKVDLNQFNNRVKSIKRIQVILILSQDLSFLEVSKHIDDITFMRKACSKFNSKFRVSKAIP